MAKTTRKRKSAPSARRRASKSGALDERALRAIALGAPEASGSR